MQSGDVVSIELLNSKASFFVNYKPFSTNVTVRKWPVKMCVLFVCQGDQVTMLRNEFMSPEELDTWMESRSLVPVKALCVCFCVCLGAAV